MPVTICNDYVDYYNEDANDIIFKRLEETYSSGEGFMIAKFGTYELSSLVAYLYKYKKYPTPSIFSLMNSSIYSIDLKDYLPRLNRNAGVFPEKIEAAEKMSERYRQDASEIDILGSYQRDERFLAPLLNSLRVNLDAYYAPFLFKNPWTQWLRGKKVLVVHPFVDSIEKQYNRRHLLFDNPNVLPEFQKLILIKSVQSAAGSNPTHENWNAALKYMEKEISNMDFDVALIGCGAYGLPLAACVKRMGKVGIHLAGWTQMLFGIYGNRWTVDQPEYARFINENWIRPAIEETPPLAKSVENGCYW